MIAGGIVRFAIGVVSGLATEGSSWPGILVRASTGALAAGLLLRWWGRVWTDCWQQAQAERQAALEKTQASPVSLLSK